MNTYQRIRDLREDADLTQKQMAEILYMQLTQYRRYETGASEVPFNIAINIAKFYHVSLDYLAGRTNEKVGLTKSALSENETCLIHAFRQMDALSQGRLLERAEMLIKK